MMHPHDGEEIVELSESLAESAKPNPIVGWLVGVGAALGIAGYGTVCLVTRSATFVDEARTVFHGAEAIALGVSYLAIACFLHAHFFWSWRPRFMGYAQIAKALSMFVVAGGVFFFVYNVLIFK